MNKKIYCDPMKVVKKFFFLSLSHMMLSGILSATDLTVSTLNDSGAGSLRTAMGQAVNGDTITLQNQLSGTILLQSPLPIIDQNLTITGNNQVAIDGQAQYPLLYIHRGTVVLNNLILQNGAMAGGDGGNSFSGKGGGSLGAGAGLFINSTANVTLNNISFLNNSVQGGNGGAGSSIYNIGAGGGGGGGFGGQGGMVFQAAAVAAVFQEHSLLSLMAPGLMPTAI
jgi:hypothetical protein